MLACLIDSTLKYELSTDFKVDAFFLNFFNSKSKIHKNSLSLCGLVAWLQIFGLMIANQSPNVMLLLLQA